MSSGKHGDFIEQPRQNVEVQLVSLLEKEILKLNQRLLDVLNFAEQTFEEYACKVNDELMKVIAEKDGLKKEVHRLKFELDITKRTTKDGLVAPAPRSGSKLQGHHYVTPRKDKGHMRAESPNKTPVFDPRPVPFSRIEQRFRARIAMERRMKSQLRHEAREREQSPTCNASPSQPTAGDGRYRSGASFTSPSRPFSTSDKFETPSITTGDFSFHATNNYPTSFSTLADSNLPPSPPHPSPPQHLTYASENYGLEVPPMRLTSPSSTVRPAASSPGPRMRAAHMQTTAVAASLDVAKKPSPLLLPVAESWSVMEALTLPPSASKKLSRDCQRDGVLVLKSPGSPNRTAAFHSPRPGST